MRGPRITLESTPWAFVSALGAALIVGDLCGIVLRFTFPLLFPPTEPHPPWLSSVVVASLAGAIAAGVVLVRAGGARATALYLAYELIVALAALPGRVTFCDRSGGLGGVPPELPIRGCDYPSLIVEQWPTWLGLAAGILVARGVAKGGAGANWTLRGAGAFALLTSVTSVAFGVLVGGGGTIDEQLTYTNLFVVAALLAAIVAGVLLAHSRFWAVAFIAILESSPLIYTVPLALQSAAPDTLEWTLLKWAGVYSPLLSAVALLASRTYAHRRLTGTFF